MGANREEQVLKVVLSIEEQIPEEFDYAAISGGINIPSPTQIVLLQEIE